MVIILPQGGQLQDYLKLDLCELENHLWAHVESKSSKKEKTCRATYSAITTKSKMATPRMKKSF